MANELKYFKIADEYYKKADYKNAIKYFKKCLEKDNDPFLYNLIGHLYSKIDKYKNLNKQLYYLKKAVEVDPDYINAIRNLGFVYNRLGDMQKSIECFKRVLELNPINDDYVAYACRQIKAGDFEEGWKYYEYRFKKGYNQTPYPEINKPKWEGEDLSDKTILVHHEQGFGDTIQFFRYVITLKSIAKKVIFRVQSPLRQLLKMNADEVEILGQGKKIEDINFDCHIPLLSLMRVRKEKVDAIPFADGYLKADEGKTEIYKEKYFNNDCFKIGITWHGAESGNVLRNIPLSAFYKLTKLKNVKIYSFQRGVGAKDLEKLPKDVEIVNLGETFEDFSDTAAAMANLDLFVTSDNCVFNLAGAMGIKTIVLLNRNSEWRWFMDVKKTPWYSSVTIFKKRREGENWALVMNRALKKIEGMVSDGRY